jgi:hypothetical protein
MLTEDNYLKLYTERDRDVVWMADGLRTPKCAEVSVSRVLEQVRGRQLAIRVLGLPQNAKLLAGLCDFHEHGQVHRLEIAGPLVCETDAERADPAKTLFRMRQCLLSPSLGGWHVASQADTAIYRLIAQRQAKPADEESDELVRQHPVWRDLSFVGRVRLRAAGEVLVHLIDPRWYIDPHHPDRTARAESFMGVQRTRGNRDERDPRYERYLTVLRAWKCEPPPEPADMERPEYFLWRIHREQEGDWRGDLRASSMFLRYLLRTWLQRIVDLTPRPQKLFSPSAMFRPYEAAAYRQHIASVP